MAIIQLKMWIFLSKRNTYDVDTQIVLLDVGMKVRKEKLEKSFRVLKRTENS